MSIGPNRAFDRLGGRLDLIGIGHVGGDHQRLTAQLLDLAPGLVEPRLAPGQQPDVGAALGEGMGDRPPHPPEAPVTTTTSGCWPLFNEDSSD